MLFIFHSESRKVIEKNKAGWEQRSCMIIDKETENFPSNSIEKIHSPQICKSFLLTSLLFLKIFHPRHWLTWSYVNVVKIKRAEFILAIRKNAIYLLKFENYRFDYFYQLWKLDIFFLERSNLVGNHKTQTGDCWKS